MFPITPQQHWPEVNRGRGSCERQQGTQRSHLVDAPSLVLPELLGNPFCYLPLVSLLAAIISGSHPQKAAEKNQYCCGLQNMKFSQFWLQWFSQPHRSAHSWILPSSSGSMTRLQATMLSLPEE